MAQEFVANKMDSTAYEDACRTLFTTQAYPLYTIDRLLHSIVRHLHEVTTDEEAQKLFQLFEYERAREVNDARLMDAYRANCEARLGEDNCYCVTFDRASRCMTLRLLEGDDATVPVDPTSVEERWSVYVDKYVRSSPTDPELERRARRTFLRRNLARTMPHNSDTDLVIVNGLECKVCTRTYKLFYVDQSEDCMYRWGRLSAANKVRHGLCCCCCRC